VLFVLFPILKENTFIVTVPLGVLMITLYDKIFKPKFAETLTN